MPANRICSPARLVQYLPCSQPGLGSLDLCKRRVEARNKSFVSSTSSFDRVPSPPTIQGRAHTNFSPHALQPQPHPSPPPKKYFADIHLPAIFQFFCPSKVGWLPPSAAIFYSRIGFAMGLSRVTREPDTEDVHFHPSATQLEDRAYHTSLVEWGKGLRDGVWDDHHFCCFFLLSFSYC